MQAGVGGRECETKSRGGLGRTDLNESNTGTHAQEDGEVLLQPLLHLLHAPLWEDCMSATMARSRRPAQGSLPHEQPLICAQMMV